MRFFAAVALMALAGCATTDGARPTEARSGFDGARVVNISGHGLACSSMICPGLGAQWDSGTPGGAIMTVRVFNDWRGITGAKLSIDGRVIELQPLRASLTNFSPPSAVMRESWRSFAVDLQTVRQIAASRKAWLRIGTPQGYIESAIVDGETDSKAFHALRRFLAQVDG